MELQVVVLQYFSDDYWRETFLARDNKDLLGKCFKQLKQVHLLLELPQDVSHILRALLFVDLFRSRREEATGLAV